MKNKSPPLPDFLKVLAHYKTLVWPFIDSCLIKSARLPSFCRLPAKYSSLLTFHQNLVSEYPRRQGKYLRPSLVMLAAQAMGVAPKIAIPTAAAMQISEDWILNHDDIEDNSLSRRGQPCLHRQVGLELALNAGDALHILMWKILTDNISFLGSKLGPQIQNEFYRMLSRTVLGQTIELKWTQDSQKKLTPRDIFLIMQSKTGYYTIAGPMRLGAILAGATSRQLKHIYDFGIALGIAFQIQDDLLDLTSDFAGLKKQTGNDIYEGKQTLMLIHLLSHASPAHLSRIKKIMALPRSRKTASQVTSIIKLMDHYGSLDYSRVQAKKYAARAKVIFDQKLKFLSRRPYRRQLLAGIDFITTRDH